MLLFDAGQVEAWSQQLLGPGLGGFPVLLSARVLPSRSEEGLLSDTRPSHLSLKIIGAECWGFLCKSFEELKLMFSCQQGIFAPSLILFSLCCLLFCFSASAADQLCQL